MTPPEDETAPVSDTAPGSDERPSSEQPLASWMKDALGTEEEGARVDVLRGVQDRLRERSGGKFYRDGWSTTRHAPFATYFITALLMLATVVLIYAIITPVIPDPVPQTKPVQVISPH
jgi:hypothetical protein